MRIPQPADSDLTARVQRRDRKVKILTAFGAGNANFSILMRFPDLQRSLAQLQSKYAIPLTRAMSRYREIKNATAEVIGVRLVKKTSTAKAHAAIRDVIVANPTHSYQQIASLLGCSRWLVYTVAVEFNVRRPRGAGTDARRHKPVNGEL